MLYAVHPARDVGAAGGPCVLQCVPLDNVFNIARSSALIDNGTKQ